MKCFRLLALFSVTGLIVGCASVDNAVMSPPGGVYSGLMYTDGKTLDTDMQTDDKILDSMTPDSPKSAKDTIARLEKLDWLLPIVEISNSGFIYRHADDAEVVKDEDKPPVYLAY